MHLGFLNSIVGALDYDIYTLPKLELLQATLDSLSLVRAGCAAHAWYGSNG